VDTRTKIVPAAEAARLAANGVMVVSGYFDPLLSAHPEQLLALKPEGGSLLVAIAEPPNPILPARARAELLAGLAVVDYVAESVEGLEPETRLEDEDERRLADLIVHVHARQRAVSS
jgi:bifunctional ADP-heptose synthase (sugar kinase/adenylyltransferase)